MPVRPAFALHPGSFGRRAVFQTCSGAAVPRLGDDVRLFATAFAAGFVFIAVLIA